ncbi:toxin-antitoxin system, toxin component [Streptomyces erythrochromogenes]|uniref:toxin-antitoxin system, toxin component n=1 Tax=Streptomyces erythrochromogenes TaxID=285574 RepID=UPI00341DF92A
MTKGKLFKLRNALGGRQRSMIQLRDDLLEGIPRPIPSDSDALFESLRVYLEQRVGRPVQLLFKQFPEGTASGLSLDLEDKWVIVVEEHTTTLHQLVIFAHEIWHVLMGECHAHGAHSDEVGAATRSLGGELQGGDIISLAARTHFNTREENDAESFGLLMGSSFRGYLESGTGLAPNEGLAGRIQASLGHRGL